MIWTHDRGRIAPVFHGVEEDGSNLAADADA
jgi:hypothetical protein